MSPTSWFPASNQSPRTQPSVTRRFFTTKRLIVRDARGLRGKKVEVYSLPYSSINMWSAENAGSILDFAGELELWTRAGKIKISVGKQVDVRRLDMLIAMCVLGE